MNKSNGILDDRILRMFQFIQQATGIKQNETKHCNNAIIEKYFIDRGTKKNFRTVHGTLHDDGIKTATVRRKLT